MTEEQIQLSRRRFELAGAIICAAWFAYLLWLKSFGSFHVWKSADYISPIWYVLVTASCYLGMFYLLEWCWLKPVRRFVPKWIPVAFLGTLLSFHISDIPLAIRVYDRFPTASVLEYFVWRLEMGRGLSLVFCVLITILMAFVCAVGLISRLARQEIADWKVEPD